MIATIVALAMGGCSGRQTAVGTPSKAVQEADGLGGEMGAATDVGAWLRENAIAFEGSEPGGGYEDLLPLKEIVGEARIVSLGEATHGTREFFQMKHRMLEFLVEEMGFNTFAIEATWPESYRVNDYVHTGEGDPARRLEGLYFWTWNTQEVLDMILWMRAHNADPGDAPEVSFYGFDMQFPRQAMDNVVDFLEGVDPERATQVAEVYQCLRAYQHNTGGYGELALLDRTECQQKLQSAYDGLVQARGRYEAQSSEAAFAHALQSARVVLQAEDVYGNQDYNVRDRYMAENVTWLLDQAGPDAKMVLWAHNGHAGQGLYGGDTMGDYLRARYGDEMVIVGFSFYAGMFNAYSHANSGRSGMTEFDIAYPPQGSYEHAFGASGLARFVLDLRAIQAGSPATDWLLSPHPLRSIGALYDQSSPLMYYHTLVLPQVFDVLIYFRDTTASQLLGEQAVSGGPPPVQPVDFLPSNLDFERGTSDWTLGSEDAQAYAIGSDDTVVHSGATSAYVRAMRNDVGGFGTLMQARPAGEFVGQRLRMTAYARTEGVAGWAGFWLRVDTAAGVASFDNMQNRPIQGDTDWGQYEIVLDVPENSRSIAFGMILSGAGQVWVDDFKFEVVGEEVPTTR